MTVPRPLFLLHRSYQNNVERRAATPSNDINDPYDKR